MADASQPNPKLESYLQKLRAALRDLPSREVDDIVREIRSHVLDRSEAGGQPTEGGIPAALEALGRPEELPDNMSPSIFSRVLSCRVHPG